MKNPVITLTTDFGTSDSYVAIVKGIILSINPKVNIVDIAHSIEPQNIAQAAFLLDTAYHYFPEQTVHMAIVDPGVGSERQGVILKTSSAFFVAPDNGILSYIVNGTRQVEGSSLPQYPQSLETVELSKGLEAVVISNPRFWRQPVSHTFHGRDIFAPVSAGLSLGISLYEFGEKINSIHAFPIPRPFFDLQGNMIGHILYVDHFGNLITDIRNTDLPHANVTIEIAGQHIQGISHYYEQREKFMALWGSSGYLEISLRNGSAYDLLSVRVGDEIKVISPVQPE